ELSACPGASFRRRVPRALVLRHGADPGSDERPRRGARPGDRSFRHVGPRLARVQRRHRRPGREPDRHTLVAGAERRGTVRRHACHDLAHGPEKMTEARFFLVVRFWVAPGGEAAVMRWLEGGHMAEML